METIECDVVVIGAGLSGLSAAYYLTKKDNSLRVMVLEAKDRVGGRTLTKQLHAADGTKDFWDIGGEWVGRPQPHMHYLFDAFGINIFSPVSPPDGQQSDTTAMQLSWQNKLDMYQIIWKLERLRKRMSTESVKTSPIAGDCEAMLFSSYLDANVWTKEARGLIDSACRCMFSIGPAEMSLLYFLMYVNAAGGTHTFLDPKQYAGGECRVKGGVQQLCHQMAQKVGKRLVYLKQPVTEIVQSIEGARVFTPNMDVLCQRVIMAIPPHHAANIAYQPPLPMMRKGLLQSVPLAFLVKFVITYEETFWARKMKQHGRYEAVLTYSGMPVGVVYEATSGRGNPALAGFVSSTVTMDRDVRERRAAILKLLEPHLGAECHDLIDFAQMDWSLEPHNGGCFLKAMMPGVATYENDMRRPFDRIHFAGTETATVWCGFMNGAVQAGFRAATEVLYHLRPLIVSSQFPEALPFEDSESTSKRKIGDHSHLWWLMWGAGCVGLLSVAFVLSRGHSIGHGSGIISAPGTFVKNIRLVFESP